MKSKLLAILLLSTLSLSLMSCGQEKQEEVKTVEEAEDTEIVDYETISNKDLEVLTYDNDALANYYLGLRYDYGTDELEQNFDKAYDYYLAASDLGCPLSDVALGYMYLNGASVEMDLSTARDYFAKAINSGAAEGYVGMGQTYLYEVENMDVETVDETQEELLSHDIEEMQTLAYRNFQAAHDKGILSGDYYLAILYQNGIYVNEDQEKAISLYEGVAATEDADLTEKYVVNQAKVALALILINGEDEDKEQAISYLDSAVEDDYKVAEYYLGVAYENGYGVEQDYEEAMKYFLQAAEHDYAPALNQIGYLYFNGYGVDTDYTQAVYYHKLAAAQDYTPAQINLGYMYENGYGVEQDLSTALAYYKLAEDKNYEGAKEAVARVENQLND